MESSASAFLYPMKIRIDREVGDSSVCGVGAVVFCCSDSRSYSIRAISFLVGGSLNGGFQFRLLDNACPSAHLAFICLPDVRLVNR